MTSRENILFGMLALGIGIYILAYERQQISDADTYARRGQVFPSFVRSEVDRVEIDGPDGRVVLVRRDDRDDLNRWRLIEPLDAETDFDAVDSLLVALEYAEDRRKLVGVGDDERSTMGLDTPTLRASFRSGGTLVPLRFGERDPLGGGRYLTTGDPAVVYVVGDDVFEVLNRPASHFRDKTVVPPAATIGMKSIRIKHGEREFSMEFGGGGFRRADGRLVSSSAIERWAAALGGLRATAFGTAADMGRVDVRLDWEARSNDEAKTTETTLSIGQRCGGAPDAGRWLSVDDGSPRCVPENQLSAVAVEWHAFEDREAVPWPFSQWRRIEVAVGSSRYELRHTSEEGPPSWRLGESTIDDTALRGWAQSLEGIELSAPEALANPARFGLANARATVRVVNETGEERGLSVGHLVEDSVFVSRSGESTVWKAPATLYELLATPRTNFTREPTPTSTELGASSLPNAASPHPGGD